MQLPQKLPQMCLTAYLPHTHTHAHLCPLYAFKLCSCGALHSSGRGQVDILLALFALHLGHATCRPWAQLAKASKSYIHSAQFIIEVLFCFGAIKIFGYSRCDRLLIHYSRAVTLMANRKRPECVASLSEIDYRAMWQKPNSNIVRVSCHLTGRKSSRTDSSHESINADDDLTIGKAFNCHTSLPPLSISPSPTV